MRLFIVLLLLVTAQAVETCETTYDDCNALVANYTWVPTTYTKMLGRDLCLDMFQLCKTFS